MPRRKRNAIPAMNPWTWWWELATQSAEMMTASAEVVARRSVQASAMSSPPSAADQRELTTMVTEKVAAYQQSATAMAMSSSSAYRGVSEFWVNQWLASAGLARRRSPSAAEMMANATQTSAKVLKAGMQPYRQRAVSNVKRLRKRKPTR